LVLSFGVYGGIEFSGTAWFGERHEWCQLAKQPDQESSKVKSWVRLFTVAGASGVRCGESRPARSSATAPMATVLNFQVGNLAPEEAFDRVEEIIQSCANTKFSAVLLCDTSEICTGFPLLRSDPLFLPTLIDLVHSHDLTFVGVGVDGADRYTTEMNAGLLSVADYRVTLSHYPTTYELSKRIVKDCLDRTAKPQSKHLTEQVACIVVDNVSGHQYSRAPRWLWVSDKAGAKELHLGYFNDYLCRNDAGTETLPAPPCSVPEISTETCDDLP
jgi:hypothetical protein